MGKLARLASIASVFAGLVGFLYLWGYWRRFGINFLEFATLTDLVRLSLVPVVSASLFAAAVYTLQIWFDADYEERPPRSPAPSTQSPPSDASPQPPAKETRKARLARWGIWTFKALVVVSIVWSLVEIYFRDKPENWRWLAPSAGLWLAFQLVVQNSVRVLGLSAKQSGVCIFLVVCIPIVSYGGGAVRAKAVVTGAISGYNDYTISNGGSVIIGQARYLGTLGEFAFFWTKDNTVRLAKWDQVVPLELSGRPKPKPDDASSTGEEKSAPHAASAQ